MLDGVLPYLFTLGNHDYPSLGGTGAEIRDASYFNNFWDYDYYAELNKMYAGFGVFEDQSTLKSPTSEFLPPTQQLFPTLNGSS